MKLHELLAVEGSLETQARTAAADLKKTFDSKQHLFGEKVVTFYPSAEDAQPVTESQSSIQSTVPKELKWISTFLSKSLDASYQVAQANTLAKADIVLDDDTVVAKDVPATALLELEKRVNELQALVAAIPTLDPAKGFIPDSQRGSEYYAARSVSKDRTKKEKQVVVLYPATTEHPAQTQLIDKDVKVGTVTEQEWSALITPAKKSEYLNRVENLSRAVRQARARANQQEVDKTKAIGASLLKYIFG
jgi:hypothetical protein